MIQWIGHVVEIVTSYYFDDYVLDPGPESLAPSTHKAFSALLDLLGWRYDSSGEKRVHEFGGLRLGVVSSWRHAWQEL